MRYVVIVAGGSGTRLWPLSRKGTPKQLLTLFGDTSLLRLAYERVAGFIPDDRILVCAGRSYLDVVAEQLPELPRENLLGEPVGRDSLNAVAWPAAVVAARDDQAVIATLTADHVIRPVDEFRASLDLAFSAAEADPDALVTFGVVPTHAHTGFGYLQRGAERPDLPGVYEVVEFAEKPTHELAEAYLAAGDRWWNSGMFVWRAATLLRQLAVLAPATLAGVEALTADPSRLDEIYPTLPKNSVDYAVMEPTAAGVGGCRVLAVPLTTQWYDLGGFPALAEHLPQRDGNAVDGKAVVLDATGNLIVNRGPGLVAVVGLTDTIVVQSGDVTLVCPRASAESIKALVAAVASEAGPEFA